MHSTRRSASALIALAAFALLLLVPASALATQTIYVGKGVDHPRLGWLDSSAKSHFGKVGSYYKDSNYAGQTVYCWKFGTKLASGKYRLEMYSNSSHKVFTFVCNTAFYVTAKGVKVGTSRTTLKSKYPGLKTYAGSVYTRYTLGSKPYTDFYVKSGKVAQIVVRSK